MKSFILSILSAGVLLTSCNNEIEINADYKDIPVVYGLLTASDSLMPFFNGGTYYYNLMDTTFIRIERGYLGTAAASESFDKPDSLYYNDGELEAWIREYNPQGQKIDSVRLIADYTSRKMDTGVFTTSGYRLYRPEFPSQLEYNTTSEYELVIMTPSGAMASAKTKAIGHININRPVSPITNRSFNGLIQFDKAANAVVYQGFLDFNYFDYTRGPGNERELKSVRINLGTARPSANSTLPVEFTLDRFELYNILASNIEPAAPNQFRFFKDLTLTIYAGGEDLNTYLQLQGAQGGINQDKPEFPGIDGGTGLFSSRRTVKMDEISIPSSSNYLIDLQKRSNVCGLKFTTIERGTDTCYCVDGTKRCF